MDESEAYVHRDFELLSKKDFRRAANDCGGTDLHFGGFLCALLLAAQSMYVDTLISSTSSVRAPAEAFRVLIGQKILPIAHKYRLPFLIRETFCSDDCLWRMRELYDQLFLTFEKYAVKSNRDHPTTLTIEIMAEILYDAQLQEEQVGTPKAIAKTQALLVEVKKGIIVGRSRLDASDQSAESKTFPITPPAENEFTFSEYVDASARSGIIKYGSGDRALSLQDSILNGLRDVAYAQHKVIPTQKQAGGKR